MKWKSSIKWPLLFCHRSHIASLVAQRLKHLPAMWETQVQSLGHEDPLEKEMAPHSSILAWRIPWTEEPGRLQSMGWQRVGHDWVTSLSLSVLSRCPVLQIWDKMSLSQKTSPSSTWNIMHSLNNSSHHCYHFPWKKLHSKKLCIFHYGIGQFQSEI